MYSIHWCTVLDVCVETSLTEFIIYLLIRSEPAGIAFVVCVSEAKVPDLSESDCS